MTSITKATDTQFEEFTITSVERQDSCWVISTELGSIGVFDNDNAAGVEPKVGDIARFYGKGFGYTVRGIDINGQTVRYQTPEEEAESHRQWVAKHEQDKRDSFEKNRAKLDADYDSLPEEFKRRLDKFRQTNPDFRWQNEPYEMSVCIDAVRVSQALGSPEKITEFHAMDWDDQQRSVPGLYDGHSGNSFGMVCRLASTYLQYPEMVEFEHGALVMLTGCETYGCPHPWKPERLDEISRKYGWAS